MRFSLEGYAQPCPRWKGDIVQECQSGYISRRVFTLVLDLISILLFRCELRLAD
jgi:hypothetical protein